MDECRTTFSKADQPFFDRVSMSTRFLLCISFAGFIPGMAAASPAEPDEEFSGRVRPLLRQFCYHCHNVEDRESGIRVDHLDGVIQDRDLRLWEGIQKQISQGAMPPEDEERPSAEQRRLILDWIDRALHKAKTRKRPKNGSIRRLTVSQYRNTLRDLLGLRENITDALPPDAVSKEGFSNNSQSMLLSPLQVEAYFNIAEKALNLCIVDPDDKPVIQNFRMDLGKDINSNPCPDKLILGANSHLLANADFVVTEPPAKKSFAFVPFRMRTEYRFMEGYQGNATVRGWREYNSIYHSVFACMRGNEGYPRGRPYQTIPGGLLLRPAIPSAELFGVESTYGPKANFKVSLRELPNHGNFRITVTAAKYDDGLLLEKTDSPQPTGSESALVITNRVGKEHVNVEQSGVYQIDVYPGSMEGNDMQPDDSQLNEALMGHWSFDENLKSRTNVAELDGSFQGDAELTDSPFGNALSVDGDGDSVVVERHEAMNVADGEYSVAAWIHPTELRQGGIVCLGKYSWTHGWYFDMPNNRGVLRIETVNPQNEPNGTVASRPGVIRANRWQHVAAVVRRGENQTRLYVNGFQVASGTVAANDLDNPKVDLFIGRIQDSKLFKGLIDDVRLYRRALEPSEIQTLIEPGRRFAVPPPPEKPQMLTLGLGGRSFTGIAHNPAFLAVHLRRGQLPVTVNYPGTPLSRIVMTRLSADDAIHQRFEAFGRRSPRMGVHVGLRRDCGSTFSPVGVKKVSSTTLQPYVFEGAINNYPAPDVEKDNVNYLAGIREIGVRSEFTNDHNISRLLIRSVHFEGPYYETWPPAEHRNIFIDSANSSDPPVYAAEIIRSFATRAFRRPVTTDELNAFMSVWEDAYSESRDFRGSVRDALLVILTSPQFLFLIENSATPEPETLGEFELASKLSYFLWNAAPDERLLTLAADGRLHESIDTEIDRLLADSRSQQFVHEFASQWLSLDKFDVVETDRKRFPALTRTVRAELRKEPIAFLRYLIVNNRPVRDLIRSDIVMANEVVAHYYGLPSDHDSGFEFQPLNHDNTNLGGVLTHASIMAGLSDGREANPVKRGAWFARRMIAEPPDDPPPNVPAIPGDDSGLTLRQKLEQHRNQDGCRKCHAGIDPWGIPMEQIDAAGLLTRQDVDARSTLPDGTDVNDLDELRDYLINDRLDQVAFSFLKHIAGYAVGRTLTYNEIEFLKVRGLELQDDDYRIREMIRFVIKSDIFMKK